MATLRFVFLSLLLALLLSISWPPTSAEGQSTQEAFIKCLSNYSYHSNSTGNKIYYPNTASYSSILQSRIQDLRFNTTKTPKPYLIITPSHESDVQAAVICAKRHGMNMTIRSGGHDYEGLSYVADVPFIMLDMYKIRSVDVNVETETAWVRVGATLGEVYYKIAEKSKVHGFPAGLGPTVGVGGHMSGGGYGTMMRKYGLTVDNIADAQLVDADGRLLDRKSMGEDLFWAIRGGGGSSFGVVIAYKIKLVRVPEKVTTFLVERTLEQNATDIVDQWQHIAYGLDSDLFLRLLLQVKNSTTEKGRKTVSANFLALFLGDAERLLSIIHEKFPKLGLDQSDCMETSWIESTIFFAGFPRGTPTSALLSTKQAGLSYSKRKSDYVEKPISREGWEGIWKKMVELEVPEIECNPLGGKMSEIPATATPYPHRAGNLWLIQYETYWTERGEEATEHYINLTRQIHDYMTPFVSSNPRRAFLNYKDLDLGMINHKDESSYMEAQAYGRPYFVVNLDKLVKVKTKVDPDNFFRNEQSIPLLPQRKM